MASKGVIKDYQVKLKPQGAGRMNPSQFARNNLAQGGVNKDLGGGATKPGKGKG
jgi:hypothetical protein